MHGREELWWGKVRDGVCFEDLDVDPLDMECAKDYLPILTLTSPCGRAHSVRP
jgi:hypothetical protein